jgi:stage V sporulation protein K
VLRAVIRDAAVSTAKAYGHATVEPRHVLFALARHFRQRPDCEPLFAPAKAALEPRGSSHSVPTLSEAATTLLDPLNSDDDGVAALRRAFGPNGDADGGATAGGAPSGTQALTIDAAIASGEVGGVATGGGTETVADVLAELDVMIGLGDVKAQVRRIIAVVQANAERQKAGLAPVNPGLHLVFTGPPGTGKTSVARLVARLYAAAGALPGSKFTEVSRPDLIAGYVGQTAIKTREVIDRTRPGVLFIDEAYALTPRVDADFGHEAIATLVKGMEDFRHELAVIVAGYDQPMAAFIDSNPGLRSRFRTFIAFPDYSAAELTQIFELVTSEAGLALAEGTLAAAEAVFLQAAGKRDFGNARFVRSLFEQAYARMATRAAMDGSLTLDELGTLLPEDIVVDSSMFAKEARPIGFSRQQP